MNEFELIIGNTYNIKWERGRIKECILIRLTSEFGEIYAEIGFTRKSGKKCPTVTENGVTIENFSGSNVILAKRLFL